MSAELASLEGKTAYVTGAAGGIGCSTCARFLAAGAEVVATDLASSDELDLLLQSTARLRFAPYDLCAADGLDACAADIRSAAPDVLFNNAASFDMGSVLQADLAQYDRIFGLNVRAMYRVMQAAAQALAAAGRPGALINLASQAGRRGEALVAHYCASKAAVISYTQSAALALAQHNIRVNALAPGVVDTPMWEQVDLLFAKFEERAPGEKKRLVGQQVPLGRMGAPDDVARAALFLACDMSAYITGQTLNVDGGNVLS